MKAMNNFESGLSASSFAELGSLKFVVIGILAVLNTVRVWVQNLDKKYGRDNVIFEIQSPVIYKFSVNLKCGLC